MQAKRRYFGLAPIILTFLGSLGFPAQVSTAFQLFLPGGALPTREIQFTLTRDDGRVEILSTDAKGKYQFAGDLAGESEYTIMIEGDGRAYGATTRRFRVKRGVTYVPVFLLPPKGQAPAPREIVDVSGYDSKAPPEAKVAYEQAVKAVSENNAEAAMSEFTRALSLYPQYLRAMNDLGALYLKLNRLDEAVSTFTQAISLNPRLYFPRLNLGVAYNRQRKYGEAIKVLDQLVKEQPALADARVQLAEALITSRQMDAAAEQLRLALADKNLESSTRADSHYKLGVLLYFEERYPSARSEFEKALAITPQAANAHMYLGMTLLNLQKMAEAETALLKAYEFGGSRVARAQLFLGQLYYTQQKFDLSRRAFEQYLKDAPRAANTEQVRALVEKIKATMKQ